MKIFGIAVVAASLMLAACTEPEPVLEGERLDVRTPVGKTTVDQDTGPRASAVRLPPARAIGSWTHRNATPEHRPPHAALARDLTQRWSADIGEGESKRARITADPVSDGARIYTIDAAARLSAISTTGQIIWSADLTPAREKAGLASGGGLATSGGVVYATTGYGTLSAFDAGTGALRWVQKLDAAPSGPPTVRGGLVYFVTRDNRAWALETGTGRIRWQIAGVATTASFSGGAGPAVSDTMAVFPFSSGELVGVLRQGGVRLWSGSVSGRRVGRVYAAIGDFAADPLIMGSNLYTGTQSGRLVGIDINSGDRLWTAQIGALGPIAAAGNALWLVSDEGRLVRVARNTGRVVWSQPLPYYTQAKVKKRTGIHANFGPILASGRLLVASSDGFLRAFDPASGAPLGQTKMPAGAAAAPIVVGNTLYIVGTDGNLRAFR